MRRYAVLILLFALAFTGTGCASSWAQRFRSDPLAALTENVNYMRTALSIARGAVDVYASVSGDSSITARFEQVAGEVDTGLLVAQDGVRVAADAGSTPNVPALMRDATTAMGHVNQFLAGMPTPAGGSAIPQLIAARRATARAAGLPAQGQ